MKPHQRRTGLAGFTLVEVMIVVVIIGLLAMIAMPAFRKVRMSSQNTRFFSDLRGFRAATDTFSLAEGYYPESAQPGNLPAGLDEYIKPSDFSQRTPLGGSWKIESDLVTFAVGAVNIVASDDQLQALDRQYDDGNTGTGKLRVLQESSYFWVEED